MYADIYFILFCTNINKSQKVDKTKHNTFLSSILLGVEEGSGLKIEIAINVRYINNERLEGKTQSQSKVPIIRSGTMVF